MNKAMLQQQFHYTLSTEDDFKFSGDLKNIDYSKEIKNIKIGEKIISKGKWYPFQIAFIVMNIKSFTDPFSEDRDIMDLWFQQEEENRSIPRVVSVCDIFKKNS